MRLRRPGLLVLENLDSKREHDQAPTSPDTWLATDQGQCLTKPLTARGWLCFSSVETTETTETLSDVSLCLVGDWKGILARSSCSPRGMMDDLNLSTLSAVLRYLQPLKYRGFKMKTRTYKYQIPGIRTMQLDLLPNQHLSIYKSPSFPISLPFLDFPSCRNLIAFPFPSSLL